MYKENTVKVNAFINEQTKENPQITFSELSVFLKKLADEHHANHEILGTSKIFWIIKLTNSLF